MKRYAKGCKGMIFTAAQAAKAVGKSTSTITRSIDNHKISASKRDDGSWQIDAAELYRVFAPAETETQSMKRDAKGELQAELDLMVEKLRSCEALCARLTDEVSDLRADRNAWRQQAERQTLFLQDQRDKDKEATPTRTGWFGKLLRKEES